MGTEEFSRQHRRRLPPPKNSRGSSATYSRVDSDDIFSGSHEVVSTSHGPLSKKRSTRRTIHVAHKRKPQQHTWNHSYIEHIVGYFRVFIRSNVEWVTSRVHSYIERHPLLVRVERKNRFMRDDGCLPT